MSVVFSVCLPYLFVCVLCVLFVLGCVPMCCVSASVFRFEHPSIPEQEEDEEEAETQEYE